MMSLWRAFVIRIWGGVRGFTRLGETPWAEEAKVLCPLCRKRVRLTPEGVFEGHNYQRLGDNRWTACPATGHAVRSRPAPAARA